jgi:ribosome biogenesis GTPase A
MPPRKAILERVKELDVVIELLDARLPGSSANPLLAQLTAGKPRLKVLNKQDLADPTRTEQWLAHYNAQPGRVPSPGRQRDGAGARHHRRPAASWCPSAAAWPSRCGC